MPAHFETFDYNFFNYSFYFFLFLLSFGDFHQMYVGILDVCHTCLRLCSFFSINFYFLLVLIRMDNLSWHVFNFTDSPATSNLLLSSSNKFFLFYFTFQPHNSYLILCCNYYFYWYSLFGDIQFSYFNSLNMFSVIVVVP